MYKMIVFDIDGTLTYKGNEISLKTLNTIGSLVKKGIKLVIATGRNFKDTQEILKKTKIKSYITNNGHVVNLDETIIYKYRYKSMEIEKILRVCEETECYYGISNSEGIYIPKLEEVYLKYFHPMLDKSFILKKEPESFDIESLIIFGEKTKKKSLSLKLGEDYNLISWGKFNFDLLKKGRSKAEGIREIAKELGIKREEIVCFGDGMNDLEMIKYAGLGIVMEDGEDNLKKYADYITDSIMDEGIYKACRKFNMI